MCAGVIAERYEIGSSAEYGTSGLHLLMRIPLCHYHRRVERVAGTAVIKLPTQIDELLSRGYGCREASFVDRYGGPGRLQDPWSEHCGIDDATKLEQAFGAP